MHYQKRIDVSRASDAIQEKGLRSIRRCGCTEPGPARTRTLVCSRLIRVLQCLNHRFYPDRLVVAAEGQILCEHERLIQLCRHLPPRAIYDLQHYLTVIQRKPGALRMALPSRNCCRQLQDLVPRRSGVVDILALVLQHDGQAVLSAVDVAGAEGVPSKTHVNLLHRLIDGKTAGGPDIDTPQALILRCEPKANVDCYDGLLAQIAGAAMRDDPASARRWLSRDMEPQRASPDLAIPCFVLRIERLSARRGWRLCRRPSAALCQPRRKSPWAIDTLPSSSGRCSIDLFRNRRRDHSRSPHGRGDEGDWPRCRGASLRRQAGPMPSASSRAPAAAKA